MRVAAQHAWSGSSSTSRRRQGMTLLEVILALAIFLFTLAAISQLFSVATDEAVDIQYQSRATRLAQSKMSEYVSGVINFANSASSSGTFDPEEPEWNWEATVTSDGSAQNLYHVTINVSREVPMHGKVQTTLTQFVFDPRFKGYISGQTQLSTATSSSSSSSSSTGGSSSGGSSGSSMSSGGSTGSGMTSGGGSTGSKSGGSTGGAAGGGATGGSSGATGGSSGATGGSSGATGGKGGGGTTGGTGGTGGKGGG